MNYDVHDLILAPVLSEKAMMGIADSRYVFYVRPGTNRVQVKKAVQEVFNVEVVKINMLKVRGKDKTQGLFKGKSAERLKAVVTLKPGQRIEQLDGLT